MGMLMYNTKHALLQCLVLVCLGFSCIRSLASPNDDIIEKAEAFLLTPASRLQQETDMRDYVKFASVGAESKHNQETRDCAEWIRSWLHNRLGMDDAALYESGYRHPVVVASSSNDLSKPAIVIYGHYDVQPADGEWSISGPFELKKMILEGYGEVFTGRGSADCKGQQYVALSALSALHEVIDGGLESLPIRIIVCIEGEEEIGSPGFAHFLKTHGQELFAGAELALSADSGQFSQTQGQFLLSTRGMFGVQIDVKGAFADLHSGSYGGSFLNPIVAITRLVASLHDPITNKITIDKFYDGVEELTESERAELDVVDDEAEAEMLGIKNMVGEVGYSTMERKTVRPTAELVGIWGGFSGEGIKTVLPSEAHAKIVFRLVAGQDPDEVYYNLNKHLEDASLTLADGLHVSLQKLNTGARAYKSQTDTVGYKLVLNELAKLYGIAPRLRRDGGSINAMADFHEVLGLETYSFGFGEPDSYIHAPDERFRLSNLHRGQRGYLSIIMKAAEIFGKPVDEL